MNPNNFKELVDHFATQMKLKVLERASRGSMVPHPLKPGNMVCQWYFNELDMLLNEVNRLRQALGRRLATFQQMEDIAALALGRRGYTDRLALFCADLVQQ